jgi:hypothetical protein
VGNIKGYEVVFGDSPEGFIGGAPVLGFRGPGEPGDRRRLSSAEREAKRQNNKRRRQAVRKNRR